MRKIYVIGIAVLLAASMLGTIVVMGQNIGQLNASTVQKYGATNNSPTKVNPILKHTRADSTDGNLIITNQNAGKITVKANPKLSAHAPIKIVNNTDFNTQFPSRVISGLDINGNGSICCIYVGNCTTAFTVENCNLYSATYGMELQSDTNAIIQYNNATGNTRIGFYLATASNNRLLSNNATGNQMYGFELGGTSINDTLAGNNASSNVRDGIYMTASNSNIIKNNIVFQDQRYGIYSSTSTGNVMVSNILTSCSIYLGGTAVNQFNTHTIGANNMVNGKPVQYAANQTGGTIPFGAGEVILANCVNVTVDNENMCNATLGMEVAFSTGCIISNSVLNQHIGYGIYMYSSTGNTISGCQCNLVTNYGIYLSSSNSNIISGNQANSDGMYGIYLRSSTTNIIKDNTISGSATSTACIRFYTSNGNIMIDNTIAGPTGIGVYIYGSTTLSMYGNTMTQCGIWIYQAYNSPVVTNYNSHTIPENNTIDGKPVEYLADTTDGTVPVGAGEVILANCDNVTVAGETMNSASIGIEVAYSVNCRIINDVCNGHTNDGIDLLNSNNISVRNSVISGNAMEGIYLETALYCTIVNNNASQDADCGVQIAFGSATPTYSTVVSNMFVGNTNYGVQLMASTYNRIYHNDFINNDGSSTTYNASYIQGSDDTAPNFWNASYPSGGNYWADWTGPDTKSGPGQNLSGPDGIVDVPYVLTGGAGTQDCYPLTLTQPIPEISSLVLIFLCVSVVALVLFRKRKY